MFNTSKSGMSNTYCMGIVEVEVNIIRLKEIDVHICGTCTVKMLLLNFFVMEPYCMTIYGDCWRQRWIAIINFFCLFLEHKNWFCWKIVLSGSGKFWSKRIIMVKLIEKQLYNDTTFVI